MNKILVTSLKNLTIAALLLFCGNVFVSCEDEITDERRFTFTGELISDHLRNNEEFSHFCKILQKASIGKKASGNMLTTLSTYGSYTCFAPTNKAIEEFLHEQSQDPKSGITSDDVNDLTPEAATEIAKNHIIEMGYRTIDVNGGNFPQYTMNRRPVELSTETNAQGHVVMKLNNKSEIIRKDIEVENGYIQVIDHALNPSNNLLPDQLAIYEEFSLFSDALKATGWAEEISYPEIDPNYDGTQVHPGLLTKAEGEAPYPEEWQRRYTLLVEPNDLFADPSKHHLDEPITTIEKLEEFAQKFYGTEAAGEYKNKNNALNKFIAYHIIDRRLYYKAKGLGGFIMEGYENGDFKSEVNLPTTHDRSDYFETMLQYSLMKVTRPKSGTELEYDIVINYAQEEGTELRNPDMDNHLNIVVQPSSKVEIEDFVSDTKNGTIHTIDKILIYDEDEMRGNVLNERMRWDITSFFPELTNNGVRWAFENSKHKITYIPQNYCERLEVLSPTTNIFYLLPTGRVSLGGYSNYQGDEFLIDGQYDFRYRIPYVPEGRYELRFGYSQSDKRGVIQIYLDGEICGIPVDLRNSAEAQAKIGWFDETGMTQNEILEKDKAMKNKGFMKGPASCHLDLKNPTSVTGNMRHSNQCIRKIIGTFPLGKKEGGHWIRIKSVTENSTDEQFNQDYFEIVPTTVLSNPSKPEDQY